MRQLVQWLRHRVQVVVQVFCTLFHKQQPCQNLALGVPLVQLVHGAVAVGGVVVQPQLAQHQRRTVVLHHSAHATGFVFRSYLVPGLNDLHAVHGLVVLAHVVVALGRTSVVIEGDARTDHVDESRSLMAKRALDQRHELVLVARKTAGHIRSTQLQRQRHQVDGCIGVQHALLALRALVCGGRKLAFCQAIHAVVLNNISNIQATPHGMSELANTDGRRVAVTRNTNERQLAVRQRSARRHRRHAPVYGVETMGSAEEVVGRLRRAPNARHLRHAVRLDIQFIESLNDGGADGVVATARTKRGDGTFVVALGETDGIARLNVGEETRLGKIRHGFTRGSVGQQAWRR